MMAKSFTAPLLCILLYLFVYHLEAHATCLSASEPHPCSAYPAGDQWCKENGYPGKKAYRTLEVINGIKTCAEPPVAQTQNAQEKPPQEETCTGRSCPAPTPEPACTGDSCSAPPATPTAVPPTAQPKPKPTIYQSEKKADEKGKVDADIDTIQGKLDKGVRSKVKDTIKNLPKGDITENIQNADEPIADAIKNKKFCALSESAKAGMAENIRQKSKKDISQALAAGDTAGLARLKALRKQIIIAEIRSIQKSTGCTIEVSDLEETRESVKQAIPKLAPESSPPTLNGFQVTEEPKPNPLTLAPNTSNQATLHPSAAPPGPTASNILYDGDKPRPALHNAQPENLPTKGPDPADLNYGQSILDRVPPPHSTPSVESGNGPESPPSSNPSQENSPPARNISSTPIEKPPGLIKKLKDLVKNIFEIPESKKTDPTNPSISNQSPTPPDQKTDQKPDHISDHPSDPKPSRPPHNEFKTALKKQCENKSTSSDPKVERFEKPHDVLPKQKSARCILCYKKSKKFTLPPSIDSSSDLCSSNSLKEIVKSDPTETEETVPVYADSCEKMNPAKKPTQPTDSISPECGKTASPISSGNKNLYKLNFGQQPGTARLKFDASESPTRLVIQNEGKIIYDAKHSGGRMQDQKIQFDPSLHDPNFNVAFEGANDPEHPSEMDVQCSPENPAEKVLNFKRKGLEPTRGLSSVGTPESTPQSQKSIFQKIKDWVGEKYQAIKDRLARATQGSTSPVASPEQITTTGETASPPSPDSPDAAQPIHKKQSAGYGMQDHAKDLDPINQMAELSAPPHSTSTPAPKSSIKKVLPFKDKNDLEDLSQFKGRKKGEKYYLHQAKIKGKPDRTYRYTVDAKNKTRTYHSSTGEAEFSEDLGTKPGDFGSIESYEKVRSDASGKKFEDFAILKSIPKNRSGKFSCELDYIGTEFKIKLGPQQCQAQRTNNKRKVSGALKIPIGVWFPNFSFKSGKKNTKKIPPKDLVEVEIEVEHPKPEPTVIPSPSQISASSTVTDFKQLPPATPCERTKSINNYGTYLFEIPPEANSEKKLDLNLYFQNPTKITVKCGEIELFSQEYKLPNSELQKRNNVKIDLTTQPLTCKTLSLITERIAGISPTKIADHSNIEMAVLCKKDFPSKITAPAQKTTKEPRTVGGWITEDKPNPLIDSRIGKSSYLRRVTIKIGDKPKEEHLLTRTQEELIKNRIYHPDGTTINHQTVMPALLDADDFEHMKPETVEKIRIDIQNIIDSNDPEIKPKDKEFFRSKIQTLNRRIPPKNDKKPITQTASTSQSNEKFTFRIRGQDFQATAEQRKVLEKVQKEKSLEGPLDREHEKMLYEEMKKTGLTGNYEGAERNSNEDWKDFDLIQKNSKEIDNKYTTDQRKFVQKVLELVNEARKKQNLSSLTLDEGSLKKLAEIQNQNMIKMQKDSHEGPRGETLEMRKNSLPKSEQPNTVGENVAYYFNSPEEVFDKWMHSEGHRDNILNPKYTHMALVFGQGDGMAKDYQDRDIWTTGGLYWTQIFGEGGALKVQAPSQPSLQDSLIKKAQETVSNIEAWINPSNQKTGEPQKAK